MAPSVIDAGGCGDAAVRGGYLHFEVEGNGGNVDGYKSADNRQLSVPPTCLDPQHQARALGSSLRLGLASHIK